MSFFWANCYCQQNSKRYKCIFFEKVMKDKYTGFVNVVDFTDRGQIVSVDFDAKKTKIYRIIIE